MFPLVTAKPNIVAGSSHRQKYLVLLKGLPSGGRCSDAAAQAVVESHMGRSEMVKDKTTTTTMNKKPIFTFYPLLPTTETNLLFPKPTGKTVTSILQGIFVLSQTLFFGGWWF